MKIIFEASQVSEVRLSVCCTQTRARPPIALAHYRTTRSSGAPSDQRRCDHLSVQPRSECHNTPQNLTLTSHDPKRPTFVSHTSLNDVNLPEEKARIVLARMYGERFADRAVWVVYSDHYDREYREAVEDLHERIDPAGPARYAEYDAELAHIRAERDRRAEAESRREPG